MAKEKLKALNLGGAGPEVIILARVAAIGIKTQSSTCRDGQDGFEHRHRLGDHLRRIEHEFQSVEFWQRASDTRQTVRHDVAREGAHTQAQILEHP